MASRDPLIGQQLANYRIEKLIGRGGMAKVYLGWDIRLHRSAAVKVIDDRFQNEPNYTERFLREARTMATWQHMNIPLVYHVGEENDILFFAMEYIHGQNLSHLLDQNTTRGELLPLTEVLRIGWAIAKALDFAHEKGVIHRDVNPSNVILADDGRVMLMDFGLALDLIQGTQGEVFGTPGYIAPEQARNSAQAVSQTDLYSLGVMLYEMLTGTTPFDDPSPIALALKHITDQPLPPSKTNPDINAEMDAVLMKALHKNPPERFQSGQALMEALETAIHWTGSESPLPTLAELPGMPDTKPTHTLAEIPADKSLNLQDEAQTPAIESPVQARAKPVSWTSRTLIIGGLGCGLIILIGLVLLVGGLTATWGRQNLPTESSLADLRTQTAFSSNQKRITNTKSPLPPKVTATPTHTPTQTSTSVITYSLSIVSNKDDSLFIVNEGMQQFPLAALEFKTEKGGISGEEWRLDFLDRGDCVTLWKEEGKPKAPKGVKCDQVGERLERSGSEKFWTAQFDIYYQGEKIGTCENVAKTCRIEIVVTNN